MQDYIAILIAVTAAAFLLRRAWQRLTSRRGGSCGSCPSCPSATLEKTTPLVTISPISAARRQTQEDFAN